LEAEPAAPASNGACTRALRGNRAAADMAAGARASGEEAAATGYYASKRLLTLAGVGLRQHLLQRAILLGAGGG
jgi:hypothetical protein